MLIQTSTSLLSLSSQWAFKLRLVCIFTQRGCCGHWDMLDRRYFNETALISVDGVWGGMLIWVIAYVNAQLGSSQCQNTSARVSECHPTLAPMYWMGSSYKHTPQWAMFWWTQWWVLVRSHVVSNFLSISVDCILNRNAVDITFFL